MKEETIKIIEESHHNPMRNHTDFSFTILLKPQKDSLEILKWKKGYVLTDTEIIQTQDRQIIDRIRLDTAIKVFSQFYQDTYITPSKKDK